MRNDVFESVHLNGRIDSKRPRLLGIFCLHLGAMMTNSDQDSPRRGYYKDGGVTKVNISFGIVAESHILNDMLLIIYALK